MKKVLVIFAAVVIYLQIGLFYSYWAAYAAYYPKSTAAEVLMSFPFSSAYSPETSEINPKYAQRYPTFDDFLNNQLGMRVLTTLFWPIQIIIWLGALACWLGYGIYLAFKFLIWLVFGGFLQWIGAFG